MSFRRDRRGFIFSFDASLAILVVFAIMIGIVRVGGAGVMYEQQGPLRLERYANDALEVMQLTGVLDNIATLVKHGYLENAENLAREQLNKILPSDVQFKLVIGDNRLTVYPSTAAGWGTTFSNAKELATATRMSTLPPKENFRVLAWLDDDNDNAFMDEIERCTGWQVTRTNDETFFQNEILKLDTGVWPNRCYYKTIFIPDAQRNFNTITESRLDQFSRTRGRLVVGGDTLWNNNPPDVWQLYEDLGVRGSPAYVKRPPKDSRNTGMLIENDSHPITTSPYYIGYRVDYAGADYYLYVYRGPTSYSVGHTTVLAWWDNVPAAGGIDAPPWRGIIFRDEVQAGEYGGKGTGVLFSMRLAQSAMGASVGTYDWITLARRAIYWEGYSWEFDPVTLYVWRGEAAS